MNNKADILSRKDQVDATEDNKDVQMLKEKLCVKNARSELNIFLFFPSHFIFFLIYVPLFYF